MARQCFIRTLIGTFVSRERFRGRKMGSEQNTQVNEHIDETGHKRYIRSVSRIYNFDRCLGPLCLIE